jgi:hypothetical protein
MGSEGSVDEVQCAGGWQRRRWLRGSSKGFIELAPGSAKEGAQLTVHHSDEKVVDLWFGPESGGDSISPVFSVGKAAVLVRQGALDQDRPVHDYCPNFIGEGKENLTVRQLFSHKAWLRRDRCHS